MSDKPMRSLQVLLECLNDYRPRIVETIQRRHILVHNGGVVNKLYLDRVSDELIGEYGIAENQEIDVTSEYLRRAIDRIHLVGIVLIHLCWRKWVQSELAMADEDLNEHIFYAIERGRYKLAQNMGGFATTIEFVEERAARNMTLNLAQAYKWDNQPDKMEEAIQSRDWSACGPVFQLAIYALRDQNEDFFNILPRAIAADEVNERTLREWPIFQQIRKQDEFEEAMKIHFTESGESE